MMNRSRSMVGNKSGAEDARTPNASRLPCACKPRASVWSACVFSAALFINLFATTLVFSQDFHPNGTDIKQILENRVDNRKSAPGIVVGIIDKDGPRIFSYGKFDADSTNSITGETAFEIGSISKAFTG